MDQLKELRKKVDKLDLDIIELLNKRAELVLAIRNLKMMNDVPVYDQKRENEITRNLIQANDGPLNDKHIKSIYKAILKCMKEFS